MAGSWTKLTTKGNVSDLEEISAVMSMLDNGLMIEDYSDFSFNGMYGELVDETILNADKDKVAVSIFVPEEKPIAEFRAFLQDRFRTLGLSVSIEAEGVSEDDWAENWKKYYKPISLGRVTIVPAWESYEAKADEVIVRMDPGMAFGTGTHETTRLVMRILQDVIVGGERVLDVGTGSGILSICASKLGAKEIFAYDIDPVAVRVAKENALADGCDNITVGVSDLLAGVDRTAPYGVCVANIVADIILRMLPDIGALLAPGAPLILSGIIAPRKEDVIAAAAQHGFLVEREEQENDWVALLVRRAK
ncbi:MAG: 50S ribosomal protein L11 methyltransferase [Clostridia bacterium]|nr:50S ribosomal protein L11 methyltransferase [Clostridia bacterium]